MRSSRRLPLACSLVLAVSAGACLDDPEDVDDEDVTTEAVAASGNTWSYRVPGMVRFRAVDLSGTERWVTGLLVAPSGQSTGPFSSRLVITTASAFQLRWLGQCLPQTTVEHGWLHTALPGQNQVTQARVVNHLAHPSLPLVALLLDQPITAERTFTPATALPALNPAADDLRCWGYSATAGNLQYVSGRAIATERLGYLFDAGGTHRLTGKDHGYVCTDIGASTWYGTNAVEWWIETTNARDLDGDGRSDNRESFDACLAENSNQFTSGRCLTEHASPAGLQPWIDAQTTIASLVNPNQFTPLLWFESAANPVCIDIPSGSFGDVNVNQWSCHRQPNQRFYEIAAGAGVAWVNVNSGRCWTASGGGVVQRACVAGDAMQRWTAVPTAAPAPAGRILRNLGTNTCVTAQGNNISVQVRLAACPTPTTAPPSQVWKTNHPGPGLPFCFP